MKTTQVTHEMQILDILPGEAPAVLLGKETAFNGGKRLFTQKVAVTDAVLFQRLCAEVRIGDKIQATVATVWSRDQYTTRLTNFCPLSATISTS